MSVKLDIWTAVKAKLVALKAAGTINHYGIWNNQIEHEENQKDDIPFEFPAVFLGFTTMPWDTALKAGNRNQFNQQSSPEGQEWLLTLYICFENYEAETSSFELNDPKFDLIIEAMHMLKINEYAQDLRRSEERMPTDHNNVVVWEVDYITRVAETFADATVIDATDGGVTTLELVINTDMDHGD